MMFLHRHTHHTHMHTYHTCTHTHTQLHQCNSFHSNGVVLCVMV